MLLPGGGAGAITPVTMRMPLRSKMVPKVSHVWTVPGLRSVMADTLLGVGPGQSRWVPVAFLYLPAPAVTLCFP